MIRTRIEHKYLVRKGSRSYVVELHRAPDGTLFVVPIQVLKHVYVVGEEGSTKEWEYKVDDAEEINYIQLPREVRAALSKAGL
ncbi:MAG: hypothetical protein DRO12_01585 [Thermoprotei archaeon]|nr:MAG: hypothetical protein DRO12_01585 [Thermoprotei archaeon]